MRVVCVYREGEDYSRMVTEWLESFRRQTGHTIEALDPDRDEAFCKAYDVVEYPTIMAISDQGNVHATWRGRELPLFNEVLYYFA